MDASGEQTLLITIHIRQQFLNPSKICFFVSTGADGHALGFPLSPEQQQQQHLLQQQQQQQQQLHPALAAITPQANNPAFQFASPTAAPSSANATASIQQPFFFQGMQQLAAGGVPRPRPPSKPTRASITARKHCNCKNSRCLKLYCECFSSGRYCDGCNCKDCNNNRSNEGARHAAVESILERNPNAFRPKIAAEDTTTGPAAPSARHNKGCNCKKSGCLKKYCECYQAGIICSENCKCVDCKNFEGSSARALLESRQGHTFVRAPIGRPNNQLGLVTGFRGAPGVGGGGGGTMHFVKPEGGGGGVSTSGPAMNQAQRQQAAKDALREVVSPEVIEKMTMLLMMLSNEEAEKRSSSDGGGSGSGGSGDAVVLQQNQQAGERSLYEEQERLVLTEFRDTLRTITKVVTDKVEKRATAATLKQNAIAAALATQQAQVNAHALQQAHVQLAAAAAAAATQGPQPYRGGPVPAGMQPVYLMQNGRPQLVLLPQQAVMAQQMAAVAAAQQQQQVQQVQVQQIQPQQQQEGENGTASMSSPPPPPPPS